MPTLYIIFNDMCLIGSFSQDQDSNFLYCPLNHLMSASFTLRASRSHCICFVAAQSRWMTTASWADASHLQRPRLVN